MKRLALLFITVSLILVVAVALLASRASQIALAYKPSIQKLLSDALHSEVLLGDVSISFLPSPSLTVSDVRLVARGAPSHIVHIAELRAQMRVRPLFSGQLALSALTVKSPKIQGTFGDPPSPAEPSGAQQSAQSNSDVASASPMASSKAPFDLGIEEIVIENGSYTLVPDGTETPITVRDITGHAQVHLVDSTLNVEGLYLKAQVVGQEPMTFSGRATLKLPPDVLSIADATISLHDISANLPRGDVLKNLTGQFSIRGALTDLVVETSDAHGVVNGQAVSGATRARLTPSRIDLEKLSISACEGSLEIPATLSIMPDAKMTLSAAIKGRSISLSALLALLRSEHKDTITGTLESIDGREISVPLDSPMRSDGNLSLKLSNASLKDVNLVQQLLGQLAGLPFISESVTDKLPPEFRAVITAPNTSIKQFDLDTRTKSGKVEINKVRLTSDIFDLTGQGTFILDHALALKGDIRLSQALSRALIGQTPELKALADSDDRLTMPVEVTGSPSKPIVTPDLDAILKRTSVSALQRALEGGLKGSKGIGKKLRNIFRF